MKEYLYVEYIKEKKEKHIFLGLICIAILIFQYITNVYQLTKQSGATVLYCVNMPFHFFVTLVFITLYSIIIIHDEFKNNTINQLIVIPFNIGKFISAKLIFIGFFSFITMFLISISSGLVVLLSGHTFAFSDLLILFILNLLDSILLLMVMIPVILIAVACRKKLLLTIILSSVYIISALFINNLPFQKETTDVMIAYFHPLGGSAVIHNALITKLISPEISMIKPLEQNSFVSLFMMIVYSVIFCYAIKVLLKNNKGR